MSFLSILDTILLGPLKLVFEIIFAIVNHFGFHPGICIMALSLIMNILVLPLYRRADAMQEAVRDVEAKLKNGVTHIKKSFSGDERMMILQTYYQQNNYSPLSALNGSVSLLLEIPFFMAAYQFLSNLDILKGVSFGPITDLGSPDALLQIGGITLNFLPILMTVINLISSAIYVKSFPLKTKIQLYAMALFFLVFLYGSPSALVFYWTLNNLFSLGKTILYKLKNPRKVLNVLASITGIVSFVFLFISYHPIDAYMRLLLLAAATLFQLPLLLGSLKAKKKVAKKMTQPNSKLFLYGSVFLTVLIGVLIPSALIASSPQEFVDINYYLNPLWYIVSSLCLAAGTFLIWMRVFYWLASPSGKAVFDKIVWIACGIAIINYMFFGTNLGIISATLKYEGGLHFSASELIINMVVIIGIIFLLYFFLKKWERIAKYALLTIIVALIGMSGLNVITIRNSINQLASLQNKDTAKDLNFTLSKDGKNVVVLMLDRAMGEYIPYIMKEKPELKEQFAGFTYYANTISFGGHTNFGAPALYGGYEYTPIELNKRDSESLASKHNESLKMLPVLFSENGFKVSVYDPPYANYQEVTDLTIFDDYPKINAHISNGAFTDPKLSKKTVEDNHRNFFCYSVTKTLPLLMQYISYDNGKYGQISSTVTQTIVNPSTATGMDASFLKSYGVLTNLSNMTKITDGSTNTYMVMTNNATHNPMILQTPGYTLSTNVNNTAYDAKNVGRFSIDDHTLRTETVTQMEHYSTNMGVMLQLGKWFDYLRENGVYDNTRIILVSDHGFSAHQLENFIIDTPIGQKNLENYMPLLMIKDFNSTEFTTSHEFMTNADVPTYATKDVIANPANPFTKKPINNEAKTAHDQFIILSHEWSIKNNNGNTFLPSHWASVKDDIWDMKNWTFYNKETVLKKHHNP